MQQEGHANLAQPAREGKDRVQVTQWLAPSGYGTVLSGRDQPDALIPLSALQCPRRDRVGQRDWTGWLRSGDTVHRASSPVGIVTAVLVGLFSLAFLLFVHHRHR